MFMPIKKRLFQFTKCNEVFCKNAICKTNMFDLLAVLWIEHVLTSNIKITNS